MPGKAHSDDRVVPAVAPSPATEGRMAKSPDRVPKKKLSTFGSGSRFAYLQTAMTDSPGPGAYQSNEDWSAKSPQNKGGTEHSHKKHRRHKNHSRQLSLDLARSRGRTQSSPHKGCSTPTGSGRFKTWQHNTLPASLTPKGSKIPVLSRPQSVTHTPIGSPRRRMVSAPAYGAGRHGSRSACHSRSSSRGSVKEAKKLFFGNGSAGPLEGRRPFNAGYSASRSPLTPTAADLYLSTTERALAVQDLKMKGRSISSGNLTRASSYTPAERMRQRQLSDEMWDRLLHHRGRKGSPRNRSNLSRTQSMPVRSASALHIRQSSTALQSPHATGHSDYDDDGASGHDEDSSLDPHIMPETVIEAPDESIPENPAEEASTAQAPQPESQPQPKASERRGSDADYLPIDASGPRVVTAEEAKRSEPIDVGSIHVEAVAPPQKAPVADQPRQARKKRSKGKCLSFCTIL